MTARHVSLLRGINVGGNNLIPMAKLRAVYESLGCEDVTTYLQSGNVVFRRTRTPSRVAAEAEAAIKTEFGRDIRVIGRTHAQLTTVVAVDPFPGVEPARRLVIFLAKAPSATIARETARVTSGKDEAILIGREYHLYCPDGIGNTKLVGMLNEKRVGVSGTGRNWRTVTRLLELSGGQS